MAKGLWMLCVNYVRTTAPGAFELKPETDYTKVESSSKLPLSPTDATNFVYSAGRVVGNNALYAIKTQNVESGKVEVHIIGRDPMARDNKYSTFIAHEPSAIDVADGKNFDFLVGEYGDLICVKRRNTESKFVEVHLLPWSTFRFFGPQKVTTIPLSEADRFDFAVTYENKLVAIERTGTADQLVVLHFLSVDYQTVTRKVVTSLGVNLAKTLTFSFEAFRVSGVMEPFMNLLGFTRGTTGSGKVEILKLPEPWSGVLPEYFRTPIQDTLAPDFQFAHLRPPGA